MARMQTPTSRRWFRRSIDSSLWLLLAIGLGQGYGPWLLERLHAG